MPDSEHNCPQLLLAGSKGENHLTVPIWTPFGHRLVGWERHQSRRRYSPWPLRGRGDHQPGSQKEDQIAVLQGSQGKSSKDFQVPAELPWEQNTGLGSLSWAMPGRKWWAEGRGEEQRCWPPVCRPELGRHYGVASLPHGFSWKVMQPCLSLFSLLVFLLLLQYWGLGPEPHCCWANNLPMSYILVSVFCCCFMVKYTYHKARHFNHENSDAVTSVVTVSCSRHLYFQNLVIT